MVVAVKQVRQTMTSVFLGSGSLVSILSIECNLIVCTLCVRGLRRHLILRAGTIITHCFRRERIRRLMAGSTTRTLYISGAVGLLLPMGIWNRYWVSIASLLVTLGARALLKSSAVTSPNRGLLLSTVFTITRSCKAKTGTRCCSSSNGSTITHGILTRVRALSSRGTIAIADRTSTIGINL